MIEKRLRYYFQKILVNPLVVLIGHKVSPFFVTTMAGIFGILFIPCLLSGHNMLALACLVLSGYLDILDGSLARHQQRSSPLGCALDIVTDRLVEFFIVFGFYLLNPLQNGLAAMLMLGSILICISSFLVVGIFTDKQSSKGFHYGSGLMERAEAFLFFIVMTLFPSYFSSLGFIFSGLVLLTAIIRIKQFAHISE